MNFHKLVICVLFIMFLAGCYPGISGTVIDAETGKPIEGAVVLGEWTKQKGIGFTSTESYKVVTAISGKDGKFSLGGNFNPFVSSPELTIYKKGYVAWNSLYIFPNYQHRENFSWTSGGVYRLEKFKASFSYSDHDSFVSRAINDTIGRESKRLFRKKYEEGELKEVIEDQNKKDFERMRGQRQ